MQPLRFLRLAPLAWVCAALAACNIVGPAYVLIHGPPKTPAQYTLEPERTTVVFVDDRASIIPRRATRLAIAMTAEDALVERGLVEEMIHAQAIMSAASLDSHSDMRSIAELGRAVGADVVVYAAPDAFSLSPNATTLHPTARFRVKVIDASNGERLWPENPEGHVLLAQMGVRPGQIPNTNSEAREIEAELAAWAGVRLAELFYEHVEPDESRVGESG